MKKLIHTLLETNIDNTLISERATPLLSVLAEAAGLFHPFAQAVILIPLGIAALACWLRLSDKRGSTATQTDHEPDPTWVSGQIAARRTMYQTASLAARARRRNSPKR